MLSSHPSEEPSSCSDYPNWEDIEGRNCAFYKPYDRPGCLDYGHLYDGGSGTAKEACCSCGGGGPNDPDSICSDFRDWKDINGFGCAVYLEYDTKGCPMTSHLFGGGIGTAEEACCFCGGGNIRPKCMDYPSSWHDDGGVIYDCEWYAGGEELCEIYGDESGILGLTAKKVCCACGGGIISPSSDSPSPSQSSNPSSAVSGQCYSTPHDWYDSDGPTYDCEWYGFGDRCEKLGYSFNNFGKTAKEACCECSGGRFGREWFPSSAPTTFPSFSLHPSVSNAPIGKASQKPSSSPSVSSKPSNAPSSEPTSSPTIDVISLIQQTLTNVIGPCATDQSCPNTAMNSAASWFIDINNHPHDVSMDLQVWKVSSRTI